MASSGNSQKITETRSDMKNQRKEQAAESDAETEISGKSLVTGMDAFLDARSYTEPGSFDVDSDEEAARKLYRTRDPRFNNHPTPRKPPPKSRLEQSDPFAETLSDRIQENSTPTPLGDPMHSSTANNAEFFEGEDTCVK